MQTIHSSYAPAAIGPYSQAILTENFLFCSGQIGLVPSTGLLAGDSVADQTVQVMKNLKAVLQEAGFDFQNCVRAEIFLTDINDFPVVNSIYEQYFNIHKPARQTIAVAALPKNAKVEISLIAIKNK